MARGGSRQGAGRKSTWSSGCTFKDTTLIRVPLKLAPMLLEIAHKLDAGEIIDFVTKLENQELEPIDSSLLVVEDASQQQKTDSATKPEALPTYKEYDLVTESEKSPNTQKGGVANQKKEKPESPLQLELFTQSVEPNANEPSLNLESLLSSPVPEKLLIRRLHIATRALDIKKKSSPDVLSAWLRKQDPDKIRWKAAEESKRSPKSYLPDKNTSSEQLKKLQEWLEKNK